MSQDKLLFDRYAPSLTAEVPDLTKSSNCANRQFADGSAVLRVILPNTQPCVHNWLDIGAGDGLSREYRVIELLDGRLFDEYLDNGQRVPSRFTKEDIEQGMGKRFREERP